jgi:hypothetical protein
VRASESLRTTVWLVRDTFRQSLASGLCWLLAALSTLFIVVCLSVRVSGPPTLAPSGLDRDFLPRFDRDALDGDLAKRSGVAVADGTLSLGLGAIRVPVARDTRGAVHFLELILASGVADTLGLLLALVWTAGFLPAFLEPRSVSVLLAKPVPRWGLLLGKYLGVLAFVAAQAAYFIVGTWLALALRTGVWDGAYLLAVPLLLLHFAIFFSFSLLLAVCTRSTVVCVFGSIAFWGLCWAVNFGQQAISAAAGLGSQAALSSLWTRLAAISYWILPKPVDLGRLVFDALGAQTHFRPLCPGGTAAPLTLAVLTSLLFTGYILLAAGRHWTRTDY